MEEPLLFIDVDGPLHPCTRVHFGTLFQEEYRHVTWADANGFKRYPTYPTFWIEKYRQLRQRMIPSLDVWLAEWHGRCLRDIRDDGVKLVWASSWFNEANRWIGPILGLGNSTATLWFDDSLSPQSERARESTDPVIHRKTILPEIQPMIDYAKGRPFVWVSSEIANVDYNYMLDHVDPERFYLVKPQSHEALTVLDLELIRFWFSKFTRKDAT